MLIAVSDFVARTAVRRVGAFVLVIIARPIGRRLKVRLRKLAH